MSAVILMLIVGIASGIFIRQRHREELNRQQKEKAEMERDREAAKRWKAEAEKQEALVREEAKAAEIRILEQNQEIDRINIENLHNSLREQQQELRTLWNRKQKVRNRLKTDNLDEWIEREVIEQVISRRMEEKNKWS